MKTLFVISVLFVCGPVMAGDSGDALCLKKEIRFSGSDRGVKPGKYDHVSGDWRHSTYSAEGAGIDDGSPFTVTALTVRWSVGRYHFCAISDEYRPFCGSVDKSSVERC